MTEQSNSFRHRLEQVEKALDRIEVSAVNTQLALMQQELANLKVDVAMKHAEAMAESKSLRKGFRNLAFSIIGGLVLGAFALATQL